MSIDRNLYLGPWVEFRVRANKKPRRHEFANGRDDAMALFDWQNAPSMEEDDDGPTWIFRYIPNQRRDGGPNSEHIEVHESGVWDMLGDYVQHCFDMIGEAAKMSVYEPEIGELSVAYSCVPSFRWGLLKWSS